MTIFLLLLFANKSKTITRKKNVNKNTGLFLNCMDFFAVRTKINKKKWSFFFVMLGPCPARQVSEIVFNKSSKITGNALIE
jgi:hypothetical protein